MTNQPLPGDAKNEFKISKLVDLHYNDAHYEGNRFYKVSELHLWAITPSQITGTHIMTNTQTHAQLTPYV